MLTILLFLKGRHNYTDRWIRYMKDMPYNVIIADGSLTDYKYSGPFEYIRYPYDATYTQYYDKVADAWSRVKTPYAVQIDNDDFLFIDKLPAYIDFLEANRDYASCRGAYSN